MNTHTTRSHSAHNTGDKSLLAKRRAWQCESERSNSLHIHQRRRAGRGLAWSSRNLTFGFAIAAVLTVLPTASKAADDLAGITNRGPSKAVTETAATKRAGFDKIVDPDADCEIHAEAGSLKIIVPGVQHGLGSGSSTGRTLYNAPRALCVVEGDFTAQVKVSGDFDPGSRPIIEGRNCFNGAGLILWGGETNFVRLERNIWNTPSGRSYWYTPLLEYWKEGRNVTMSGGTDKPFFTNAVTRLRMTRRGDVLETAVSNDGEHWIESKPIRIDMPRQLEIGVAAVNNSKKPFAVQFEDFSVQRFTAGF